MPLAGPGIQSNAAAGFGELDRLRASHKQAKQRMDEAIEEVSALQPVFITVSIAHAVCCIARS